MAGSGNQQWLGQGGLAWNILLVARLREVPSAQALLERLATMSVQGGWAEPNADSVLEGELGDLLPRLAEVEDPPRPVSLGLAPGGLLVVRAHHAHVDGLGLLAVLRSLVVSDLASGASGIGDRHRRSTVGTIASRLSEAMLRPPAGVVAVDPPAAPGPGDVFATRVLPATFRTGEVAHAAVQAIAERNATAGRRARRVALAVGVSLTGGRDLRLGDDSGFLRITGAERFGAAELTEALAHAPLQVGGTASDSAARRAGGLIRWASKTFANRLGSTVLVSHLGRVQSEGLEDLAFYPFAGSGSGLALGAATVGSTTRITLRAPRSRYSTADLELLLDAVAAVLR